MLIIPKSAQAIVKINTKNVIIKKIITGNMGEVSKKFNFAANVDKGTVYNKTNTFDLSHNEDCRVYYDNDFACAGGGITKNKNTI